MGWKVPGVRLLLKGGALNRTNWISARRAEAVEFNDAWYRRQSMVLANWRRTNAGLAENIAALNFPTPTANAGAAPTHWGMHTAQNAGELLATHAFTGSPLAPALNASFGFDAGMLEIGPASGAVTGLGLKRAYETGLVSGTTYMGLFERQPSQANPGPIDAREPVAAAGWIENVAAQHTVRNQAAIAYGVQATDVPRPLWVGLFDMLAGGNLLWEDEIDMRPADPLAQANLTIPALAVSIGFTVDA